MRRRKISSYPGAGGGGALAAQSKSTGQAAAWMRPGIQPGFRGPRGSGAGASEFGSDFRGCAICRAGRPMWRAGVSRVTLRIGMLATSSGPSGPLQAKFPRTFSLGDFACNGPDGPETVSATASPLEFSRNPFWYHPIALLCGRKAFFSKLLST
jgi:hypothetical protein